MLLGMWSVFARLSDDQRLPVLPGILAAPNETALNSLVERSINYRPSAQAYHGPGPRSEALRPAFPARMMRNLFADYGCTTHSLVILAPTAVKMGVSVAPATNQWQVAVGGPDPSVKTIPLGSARARRRLAPPDVRSWHPWHCVQSGGQRL